jgi:hypothetical protein
MFFDDRIEIEYNVLYRHSALIELS